MDSFQKIDPPAQPEPAPKETKKANRKRKVEQDETDMRRVARRYCASIEEWNEVKNLSAAKLEDFCHEKEFINEKKLNTSIIAAIHNGIGLVLDKLTRGNGYVYEEITNDLTLRAAIEEEGVEWLQYITNRVRIALLSTIDTINGKRIQRQNEPADPIIEEEEEEKENNDTTRTMEGSEENDPTLNSDSRQEE